MFKKNTSPYGWLSYRQNLIVLYQEIGASDARIDELIAATDYGEEGERPRHAKQWADVDEIELRLFAMLDDPKLIAETERKFVQARSSGYGELAKPFEKQFRAIKGNGVEAHKERKAIAIAFLEELFVKYSYIHSERNKRAEVSGRLMRVGIVTLGMLVLLLGTASVTGANMSDNPSWFVTTFNRVAVEYGGLFAVVYFGVIGAYFSRIFAYVKSMKELRWNELDMVYSHGAISVRLLLGAIAAIIVYFLMVGGILSGPLFIEGDLSIWQLVEGSTDAALPLRPGADFARVVVWCTLAGFFERFVPDRLGELESKASLEGETA